MDSKILGERLRMIRKQLGIRQQQLAKATNLTQPSISRLENGEETYASVLLAVLCFYREKICLDTLLAPEFDKDDKSILFTRRHELCRKIEQQLSIIIHDLDKSKEKIVLLKNNL